MPMKIWLLYHVEQAIAPEGYERPNGGVSRAAGDGRERTSWRQETVLKSRAQVGGCASSVGLHALLGGRGFWLYYCALLLDTTITLRDLCGVALHYGW
jgi:hypothetical protein